MKIIVKNKSDLSTSLCIEVVNRVLNKDLPFPKFNDYKVNDKVYCCLVKPNKLSTSFTIYNQ